MIAPGEISAAAERLDVHVADVQRDYVYGWLINAIASDAYLGPRLILKGGTCLRKIYLPSTRFSSDLDFSALSALDNEELGRGIVRCCAALLERAGIAFDLSRTSVVHHRTLAGEREPINEVYRANIYFSDFYGQSAELTIAVQLDVASFDAPVLGEQLLPLVHQYSDADACRTLVRCLALEELVASKLKCMLQRRHVLDLFDAAYSYLFRNELNLRRAEVLRAFARKTIFESNLGVARDILLGVPLANYEEQWDESISCPSQSRLNLDGAQSHFYALVQELFGEEHASPSSSTAFFPATSRFPIIEGGATRRLLRLTYDGVSRLVEPYALLFKRPEGGPPREYFYCWNVEGGSSAPGWRSLLAHKLSHVDIVDREFEPRAEIQLSKAGERPRSSTFRNALQPARTKAPLLVREKAARSALKYTLQCPYCRKRFTRTTRDTALRPHKSPDGFLCRASRGYWV